jgi:tRNA threonylcarbamoyladenosine biosynthesis protein TsaB
LPVLAIDTTTPHGSVALAEGESVLGEVRLRVTDSHSAHVLPAADFLLDALGLNPAQLDGCAVTTGPGSFTGLRVGLSTAQGLALAAGVPCLGVSALDVLAQRIAGAADTLVAMIDAYRGEVYAAVYERDGRIRADAILVAPERLLEGLPEAPAFIGDGALKHSEGIRAARPRALFPSRSLYLAGTLARMAGPRLSAGEGIPPAALRPLYLRSPDIRRPPA